jgi:hypothetical protein
VRVECGEMKKGVVVLSRVEETVGGQNTAS